MATPPVFTAGSVLTAAQMNAVGLWKVTSYSFTNNAAPYIDNCFTSDFRNYKVLINVNAATGDQMWMRFRNGSGDVTTANYNWAGFYISQFGGATINGEGSGGALSYARIGYAATNVITNMTMEIMNPFDTGSTAYFCPHQQGDSSSYTRMMQGQFYGTGSMTGLKVYLSGNYNMTGTITVYGFTE